LYCGVTGGGVTGGGVTGFPKTTTLRCMTSFTDSAKNFMSQIIRSKKSDMSAYKKKTPPSPTSHRASDVSGSSAGVFTDALRSVQDSIRRNAGSGFGGILGSAFRSFRETRSKDASEEWQKKLVKSLFKQHLALLMKEEGQYTYRSLLNYYQGMQTFLLGELEKAKVDSTQVDVIKEYKAKVAILQAMTPTELDHDHYHIFCGESKSLIAEAAQTDVAAVNRLILEHDSAKTDRSWIMRRIAFRRPIFQSVQEMGIEAPMDRPIWYPLRSLEFMKQKQHRGRFSKRYQDPRDYRLRKSWAWFRRPTSGIDRLRTGRYTKNTPRLPLRKKQPYMYLESNPVRVSSRKQQGGVSPMHV